jgi:hypothetical protein
MNDDESMIQVQTSRLRKVGEVTKNSKACNQIKEAGSQDRRQIVGNVNYIMAKAIERKLKKLAEY